MAEHWQQHVSMRQVAAAAGVAESTVCRILKGSTSYSPQTRQRVLAAARKLKYRPNTLVRGILWGRSRNVGVIVPADRGFYGKMVSGIHDALLERDYAMILTWNSATISDPGDRTERRVIHNLIERRVDGIILRPTADEASRTYFTEIWERRLPLVVVDRELRNVRSHFLGSDDVTGGRLAAEHLLALGHRRLAVVGYYLKASPFRRRCESFLARIAQQPGAVGLSAVRDTVDDAAQALHQLLAGPHPPTAVFGLNDDLAKLAYDVAAALGLGIPADLSVVGFGDLPYGPWLTPPLTSVEQFPYDLGRSAANMLLDCLDHPDQSTPRIVQHPVEMLLRASTGPAAICRR